VFTIAHISTKLCQFLVVVFQFLAFRHAHTQTHRQTPLKTIPSLSADNNNDIIIKQSYLIVGSSGESEQAVQQSEEMGALSADSDWHALSQKEEADLDTIMSQCEFAISNAEKFADQLSRDLI